jgi:hypothetical protein
MRFDAFLTEEERKRPLSPEEADGLWTQYAEAYVVAEGSFDVSVRNLAAAGIGVTAALAAGFDAADRWGAWAVSRFFFALLLNLASHVTERRDVGSRLRSVKQLERAGAYGNTWTTRTMWLNAAAGAAVLAGSACLLGFVVQST